MECQRARCYIKHFCDAEYEITNNYDYIVMKKLIDGEDDLLPSLNEMITKLNLIKSIIEEGSHAIH